MSSDQISMKFSSGMGKENWHPVSLDGEESVSRPFHYQLEWAAPVSDEVSFDQLIGKSVTIELAVPGSPKRTINGMVLSLTQLHDDTQYQYYALEIVPLLWRLSKRINCQIFQRETVVEIAESILERAGVPFEFALKSDYLPHNYCVQYQESDLTFLNRLLEEHGIHYYFRHDSDSHLMVLSDSSSHNPSLSEEPELRFNPGKGQSAPLNRVYRWEKTQRLRGGKVTLWDYSFELPNQNLESQSEVIPSVMAGTVNHRLQLADNDDLAVYEFPGSYAHLFDGIGPGGTEEPANVQNVFKQNVRSARLRMEEEASESIVISGECRCGHLYAGACFSLRDHRDGDGDYFLTSVKLHASSPLFGAEPRDDRRSFTCRFSAVPSSLPYRPKRQTPRRQVQGVHTAVVVGPPGEEIFTDKYGRVKVQFHWDRSGKRNADSSCWLRVSRTWAGSGYGSFQLPRVGHEVLVGFVDGDIDQPFVIGSVYNAASMPPVQLPQEKNLTGTFTRSRNGGRNNGSLIHVDDTAGSERVVLHSENHLHQSAEKSRMTLVGWGQASSQSNTGSSPSPTTPSISGSGGGSGGNSLNQSVLGAITSEQASDRPLGTPSASPLVGYASANNGLSSDGAGQGGGSGNTWQQGSVEKCKGSNIELTFGNSLDCAVGGSEEFVFGVSITGVLGAAVELVVGFDGNYSVGPTDQGIVGNNATLITGDQTQLVKGNTVAISGKDGVCYAKGNYIQKIDGGYFEEILGDYFSAVGSEDKPVNMGTMFNGKLVEYLSADGGSTSQIESYDRILSKTNSNYFQIANGDIFLGAEGTLTLSAKKIILCAEEINLSTLNMINDAAEYSAMASDLSELFDLANEQIEFVEGENDKECLTLKGIADAHFGAASKIEKACLSKMIKNSAIAVGAGVLAAAATTVAGNIGSNQDSSSSTTASSNNGSNAS